MVLSLVSLCSRVVVSDHSSSPSWLRWMPRELYRPLLDAAFAGSRPLAVGELVQRWPLRRLQVNEGRKPGHIVPNRLCVQALLLAVVRGLSDQRCTLQVLDVCGLQAKEGGLEDPMGGWSLTVTLCTMIVQAQAGAQRAQKRERERERKRFSALERDQDVKRERGLWSRGKEGDGMDEESTENKHQMEKKSERTEPQGTEGEEELIKGVRRRMEMERRREPPVSDEGGSRKETEEKDVNSDVIVLIRADLFANARSLERVRAALSTQGPLKLQCRYLRVEEINVNNIWNLLELLPRQGLLGVDIRYSNLRVAGLVRLLPVLSTFPDLKALRLHYCNLDFRRNGPGQDDSLRDLAQGLAQLQALRRLSLTAVRLPGQLRVLLSSLPRPLEILELTYLGLSSSDLAYLSSSHHAATLQQLDLSENCLDERTLPSIRRLLAQASSSLQHLSLSGCGLSDGLLGLLLPSVGACRNLKSLTLALNPISIASLMDLMRMAVRMPSLRLLIYPNPLEDYEPGLPELPSSAQLLDWPMDESRETNLTSSQLNRIRLEAGRSDLCLTADLFNCDQDLVD